MRYEEWRKEFDELAREWEVVEEIRADADRRIREVQSQYKALSDRVHAVKRDYPIVAGGDDAVTVDPDGIGRMRVLVTRRGDGCIHLHASASQLRAAAAVREVVDAWERGERTELPATGTPVTQLVETGR